MPISPGQLPDDPAALKAIIAAMAQDATAAQAEIARLRFQLARYRRAEFGRSSERLARETEQLELAIETLEADQAERLAAVSPMVAAAIEAAVENAEAGSAPAAAAPAARGGLASCGGRLPRLRRRAAPDRRGRQRDA
ncbi:MAG: transposase domain-containing protein [Burkholderiales bacterium]